MLLIDKSIDVNYVLITLICEYIYENKPKVYFLSTCKFMRRSRIYVLFYEQVNLSRVKNNKIKKRLTNIDLGYDPMPTKRLLDNILTIKISDVYRTVSDLIITYLPPRLKKLEILHPNVRIDPNTRMPKTLEILQFENSHLLLDNFFNYGLKRLIMNTCYTSRKILLPTSLKYLKLSGNPNIVSFPNLKCLILDTERYNITEPLPDSIKHLGLYTSKHTVVNLDENIISKNLTHFEFDDYAWCDILNKFPKLTKITTGIKINIEIIPSNIISISIGYHTDYRIYKDLLFHRSSFLSGIKSKTSITTLSINQLDKNIRDMIPETIFKLKICIFGDYHIGEYCCTDPVSMIPKNITELCIENLILYKNKLCLPSNIKKLKIKYAQRQLLDPSVYIGCRVIYKY